jgi:hypothetical protein
MYAMWGKGRMFGGMFDRTPEMASMRPFWLVYIHVKDVAKAMDIATRAGAFVQRPRMDIPGGTIAILGDPQGAGFALHDLTVGGMTGTRAENAPSRAKAKATPVTSSAKASTKTASTKKASKKQATTKQATKKKATKKKAAKKKAAKKKAAKKVGKKTTKRTAKRTEARAGKRPAKKSVKRSATRRP